MKKTLAFAIVGFLATSAFAQNLSLAYGERHGHSAFAIGFTTAQPVLMQPAPVVLVPAMTQQEFVRPPCRDPHKRWGWYEPKRKLVCAFPGNQRVNFAVRVRVVLPQPVTVAPVYGVEYGAQNQPFCRNPQPYVKGRWVCPD